MALQFLKQSPLQNLRCESIAGSRLFHASIISFFLSETRPHKGSKARLPTSNGPSRTRLAKDLTPRSGPRQSGQLKVAPRERRRTTAFRAPFERDVAPHTIGASDRLALDGSSRFGRRPSDDALLTRTPASTSSSTEKPGRSNMRFPDSSRRSGSFSDRRLDRSEKRSQFEERRPQRNERLSATMEYAPKPHDESDNPQPRARIRNPLSHSPPFDSAEYPSLEGLPTSFGSPPLLPGLLSSLSHVLGPNAKPTPIQALSLKHLFESTSQIPGEEREWKQFLLASETGSGKSIAYLLPLLQDLKQTELDSQATSVSRPNRYALNPRGLILAPTHELSRQLTAFAKAFLHVIKLRVLCASKANVKSRLKGERTASKMSEEFGGADGAAPDLSGSEFEVKNSGKAIPVDIVVGTPSKLMEMIRGRSWNRVDREKEDELDNVLGREKFRGSPQRLQSSKPEMGLEKVEWVIVDEADVLFDPDFQQMTRMLLSDISAARGHAVPFTCESPSSSSPLPNSNTTTLPVNYPFNLILTSATIPSSLASYLDTHHPSMTRLASPGLHHLPKTLKTEYVSWTGGNRNADVEHRIRRVWASDALEGAGEERRSKVVVFCNKSTKVVELGSYLREKGIPNVALTSSSDTRKKGSNHHLDGFLRKRADVHDSSAGAPQIPTTTTTTASTTAATDPHVMITTSLLSRGLDFSPSIKHVFIVDEPRNMIDFLHRAGRAGRAGQSGKVVVFGKMKGRGSEKSKAVRRRVGALAV